MDSTSHVMLVGEAADAFADAVGEPRENLLSPEAAKAWESWTRDGTDVDQVRDAGRPVDRGGGRLFDEERRWAGHDTIGTLALDSRNVLAGACSTSGSPWKLPGRVGDSPIVGHGLYVDPEIGAVTATGSGELVMGVCGAMLGVEEMRRGADPTDALVAVLQRIESSFELEENHQVGLVALRRDGRTGSAALRGGFKVGITTSEGDEVLDPERVLYPGDRE